MSEPNHVQEMLRRLRDERLKRAAAVNPAARAELAKWREHVAADRTRTAAILAEMDEAIELLDAILSQVAA